MQVKQSPIARKPLIGAQPFNQVRLRTGLGFGAAIALANGATEANHVSVGVGDGSPSLAMVLVPGPVHLDRRPFPFLGHAIGVLTVDVEHTVTRKLVPNSLGKMDREVSIPVSEGI